MRTCGEDVGIREAYSYPKRSRLWGEVARVELTSHQGEWDNGSSYNVRSMAGLTCELMELRNIVFVKIAIEQRNACGVSSVRKGLDGEK